jgi:[ribosomal protein S18]-alanine N-acetyltransferase
MSSAHRLWLGGASDAAVLAGLHAEAMSDAWPAPAFASLLARGEAFVLLGAMDGVAEAQGFILMRVAADEAEVLTFCVANVARRGGLGMALLRLASEMAGLRGATRMFLEVSEDNRGAAALYQKNGFDVVGRRSAYYRNGSQAADALVMRKAILTLGPSAEAGIAPFFQDGPESTKRG